MVKQRTGSSRQYSKTNSMGILAKIQKGERF